MLLRKEDWHHADIIASLHKQRTTLAALSRSAGLSSSTLANALSRPCQVAISTQKPMN
jgi:Ner family transcriptional regulator